MYYTALLDRRKIVINLNLYVYCIIYYIKCICMCNVRIYFGKYHKDVRVASDPEKKI